MMTNQRMTNAEAVVLCRYAKAACPQQAVDEYTPDAWFDLLGDLRFEDCKQGLRNVVKVKPFVSPAEIREAVSRLRIRRLDDYGTLPDPPAAIDELPEAYSEWLLSTKRAIMDGSIEPGDDLNDSELIQRAMPDFAKLMPTPPHVTRSLGDDSAARASKVAETKKAIAGQRPARIDVDLSDPHRERCRTAGCVRALDHTGPHSGPPRPAVPVADPLDASESGDGAGDETAAAA